MTTRTACAFALAFALAGTAAADPIQIVSSSRTIGGSAAFTDDEFLGASEFFGRMSAATGVFDATGAVTARTDIARLSVEASQRTVIDPVGHFFGSGSIGVSGSGGIREVGNSAVGSDLAVQFVLARATAFRFSGTMKRSEAFAQAFIEGGPGGGRALDAFPSRDDIPEDIHRTGVLLPGSYLFAIRAGTSSIPVLSAAASYDFDFSLQPVPEPASIVLVGVGGAGMLLRRRKRTSASQMVAFRNRPLE